MENKSTTTSTPDLLHPEDAEYIWLPIVVLVGVLILAGLVYAMSRVRCTQSCFQFKRRSATRNGYANVDEDDSDVSMVGTEDIRERNSITYLLDGRLHISPQPQGNQQADANDVAVLA